MTGYANVTFRGNDEEFLPVGTNLNDYGAVVTNLYYAACSTVAGGVGKAFAGSTTHCDPFTFEIVWA